jgi:hypothetical protein
MNRRYTSPAETAVSERTESPVRQIEITLVGSTKATCRCWCHREFVTVVEAAHIVSISRAQAYELAGLYRRTDGVEGLPVVAIGHALRVPVALLREWCGIANWVRPCSRCGHVLHEARAS